MTELPPRRFGVLFWPLFWALAGFNSYLHYRQVAHSVELAKWKMGAGRKRF